MKWGFPLATPRVVFTRTKAFSGKAKDILPEKSRSFVVYEYSCCCGQHYVGKTTQRFSERIKQHVPSRILKSPPDRRKGKSDSAITDHLKSNIKCIGDFESMNGRFRSLAQARNRPHLDILEALYIAKMSPSLCRQKEHVRALSLAWGTVRNLSWYQNAPKLVMIITCICMSHVVTSFFHLTNSVTCKLYHVLQPVKTFHQYLIYVHCFSLRLFPV